MSESRCLSGCTINPVDHHISIGGCDMDASTIATCSCGVTIFDTPSEMDLGDLLGAVERHLQGRDDRVIRDRHTTRRGTA